MRGMSCEVKVYVPLHAANKRVPKITPNNTTNVLFKLQSAFWKWAARGIGTVPIASAHLRSLFYRLHLVTKSVGVDETGCEQLAQSRYADAPWPGGCAHIIGEFKGAVRGACASAHRGKSGQLTPWKNG